MNGHTPRTLDSTPAPRRLSALLDDAGLHSTGLHNTGLQNAGLHNTGRLDAVVTGRRRNVKIMAESVRIMALCDDTRQVGPNALFVAIAGEKYDGHAGIGEAVRRGAVAVVVDKPVDVPPGVATIRVPDTRQALARLAAAWHLPPAEPALRLVGITGTNGKSTVAWMVRHILNLAGHPTALFGTIEYDLLSRRIAAPLTTPGPLALCAYLAEARRSGATCGVLEVSSHALDQKRTDGLTFDVTVFTNLSGDHLDYHGTLEAYRACKARLFRLMPATGTAVINGDDPAHTAMRDACPARTWTFSRHPERHSPERHHPDRQHADIAAHDIHGDIAGSSFRLAAPGFDRAVRIAMPGAHNVANALAAAGAALALDVDPACIVDALARVTGVPGRLERVGAASDPFSVFVDYAHTDDALVNVLSTLRPLTKGRLICVFGCGGDRDRSKRPRMAAAAQRFADRVVVTSDNPRTEDPLAIIEQIVTGLTPGRGQAAIIEPDRREAIRTAVNMAERGDTVLIAGKGHEDYQILGERVIHFDDVEEARRCLPSRVRETEAVA